MKTRPVSTQHQKQLEIIGLYIKNLRLEENLTQLELSEQLNLHYNTIQRIEKGANTTLITIFELAEFFGLTSAEILSIIED
jgi:transcriptional regulator with XRE-family HTH domain